MSTNKSIKLKGKEFKTLLKLHKKYIKYRKRYETDEDLLRKHIKEFLHEHTDLSVVYFKSTLINSFFSTRMGADLVYNTAEKICKVEIDLQKIIEDGPENHLEELTSSFDKKNGPQIKNYHPFSFFTKYLAIHSKVLSTNSKFPIYDHLVEKVIKNSDLYSEFTKSKDYKDSQCGRNLKKYKNLYYTLKYFSKHTKCDFSSLDKVLWLIGKAKFSKNKDPELKSIKREINQFLK